MASAAATLSQTFELQADKYGPRTFLRDKHHKEWRDHSWRDIADAAMRVRAGLARFGIKPGDRVAILAENCPQWVVVDQAILGLGAIVVPLFTTSGAEEIQHVISDSGARLVAVYGDALIKKVASLRPSLPAVEGILAMHPEPTIEEAGGFRVLTLAGMGNGDLMPSIEGSRDDVATFIYTSGTTGMPKGAMLTHWNILANCDANARVLNLNENDLTLSFLPIAHSFERTGNYYTVMIAGGTVAYAEGLTQIAQNLLEVEPTVLLTVPRLLEVVYNRVMRTVAEASPLRRKLFNAAVATGAKAAAYRHRGRSVPAYLELQMMLFRRLVFKRIRSIFGGRLRYLISGGAPLPADINNLLSAAELPLVEGYGLTEASPVVACNRHGRTRIGTVGQPLDNIQVKTASDGELLVHGPNVMKGYYGREAETREVIDADGWLHTGDIVQIDAEGYIKITDRKKEIIVLSGGKNISPAYLESRLLSVPHIGQVCVIGDRRKHLAALIVPDFDNLAEDLKKLGLADSPRDVVVTDSRVQKIFQTRMREFNQGVSDVEAISTLTLIAQPFTQDNGELTPTMKLRRRVIQEHYHERIEQMYGN